MKYRLFFVLIFFLFTVNVFAKKNDDKLFIYQKISSSLMHVEKILNNLDLPKDLNEKIRDTIKLYNSTISDTIYEVENIERQVEEVIEGKYEHIKKIDFIKEKYSELYILKKKIAETEVITYLNIIDLLNKEQKEKFFFELKRILEDDRIKMHNVKNSPNNENSTDRKPPMGDMERGGGRRGGMKGGFGF